MCQALLQTRRLELVPLAEDHLEHEVELDADPEVMRYLAPGARTRAEVEQLHRGRLAVAERVPGLGFWVGFVDDQFIGWWILEPPDRPDQGPVAGRAELGYRLLRRHWRTGLASEGARELIRHGFEDLGLDRIFAETMAVNAPSRATMTSIGMVYATTFFLHYDHPLPVNGNLYGKQRTPAARSPSGRQGVGERAAPHCRYAGRRGSRRCRGARCGSGRVGLDGRGPAVA